VSQLNLQPFDELSDLDSKLRKNETGGDSPNHTCNSQNDRLSNGRILVEATLEGKSSINNTKTKCSSKLYQGSAHLKKAWGVFGRIENDR
jgi:hypothetical protein